MEELELRGCSSLFAVEVPSKLSLFSLKTLIIKDYSIEAIPEVVFGLPSLVKLEVFANRLINLPQTVSQLVSLQHLTLRCFELEAFPSLTSAILQNLTYLCLYTVGEVPQELKLPEQLFLHTAKLAHLEISSHGLERIPDGLQHLQQLTYLCFSSMRVKHFPDVFKHLTALRELALMSRPLQCFPPSLFRCSSLTSLVLFGGNKLSAWPLPCDFGALTALRKLRLKASWLLEDLPKTGWSQLKRLEQLNISADSEISYLPKDIFQLPSLKQLRVSCKHHAELEHKQEPWTWPLDLDVEWLPPRGYPGLFTVEEYTNAGY